MSQDLKQDQVPKQMTQATGSPTPAPALATGKQDLKQDQVPKQMTQATGPSTPAPVLAIEDHSNFEKFLEIPCKFRQPNGMDKTGEEFYNYVMTKIRPLRGNQDYELFINCVGCDQLFCLSALHVHLLLKDRSIRCVH